MMNKMKKSSTEYQKKIYEEQKEEKYSIFSTLRKNVTIVDVNLLNHSDQDIPF